MKLVLQGKALTDVIISQFVERFNLKQIGKKEKGVCQFLDASLTLKENVAQTAEVYNIDYAFVSNALNISDYKLLAMDMDSTFIQIECIDEIADYCGKKNEVAEITAKSMRGEIDFDDSLRARVQLLKGISEKVLSEVYEKRLTLNAGAFNLLKTAQLKGIKTLLVSGGFTYFTERLKADFGFDFTKANELEIVDGYLTGNVIGEIVNAEMKANYLLECCKALNIKPSETITIGDGANDMRMMAISGLSIAHHAKPNVKAIANVSFDYVGLDGVLNLF